MLHVACGCINGEKLVYFSSFIIVRRVMEHPIGNNITLERVAEHPRGSPKNGT